MHREVHFIAPTIKGTLLSAFYCWRRRRDLNPCAGHPTYSLSRGAPSPLGYFCKYINFFKKTNLTNIHLSGFIWRRGWDSNPCAFWANGFQDRLVMTTSIPLRVFVPKHINTSRHVCQHFFYYKKLFYFLVLVTVFEVCDLQLPLMTFIL